MVALRCNRDGNRYAIHVVTGEAGLLLDGCEGDEPFQAIHDRVVQAFGVVLDAIDERRWAAALERARRTQERVAL